MKSSLTTLSFRILLFFLIIPLAVNIAVMAVSAEDIDWKDPEEFTLDWGEEINVSGYTIEAIDFSKSSPTDVEDDFVMLSVKSNKSDSWNAVLGTNQSVFTSTKVFDDLIKINASKIVTGSDIPIPYTVINVSISNETKTSTSWINNSISFSRTTVNEIYIDQKAHVTVRISNLKGIHFEKISIKTSLSEGLIVDPDQDLDFEGSLPSRKDKTFHYSVRALKPGNYTLNPVNLNLTYLGIDYHLKTNDSYLVVHGPFINVSKEYSLKAEDGTYFIDISTIATNEGDRAAYVKFEDRMPDEVEIIGKDKNKSGVLYPDQSFTINSSLKVEEKENLVLPSSFASFSDSSGYSGYVSSGNILIPLATFNITDEKANLKEPVEMNTSVKRGNESVNGTNNTSMFGSVRSVKDFVNVTMEIIYDSLNF
jgi:hypothetical protein